MKKLIAVLTLFFAFAFSANAQDDKKMDAVNAAKLDAVKMSEALKLDGQQQEQFINLFVMKHQTLNDPSIPDAKKKEMSYVVEAKIRATLNADQTKALDSDPALLAQLTGPAPAPKKDAPKKK